MVGELLLLGVFRAARLLTSPASSCRNNIRYHFMAVRAAARCPCSITLLKQYVVMFMVLSPAATCSCWSMYVTSFSGEVIDTDTDVHRQTQTHAHAQAVPVHSFGLYGKYSLGFRSYLKGLGATIHTQCRLQQSV